MAASFMGSALFIKLIHTCLADGAQERLPVMKMTEASDEVR